MNKFQIAFYIALVIFIITILFASGALLISIIGGARAVMYTFLVMFIPVLCYGTIVYALKDWETCGEK